MKGKKILPRTVKERNKCLHNNTNQFCVIWKKNRKDSLLNGVNEKERNFKYNEIGINEKISSQRFRYRFPKHEIIDQVEIVFVVDSETYNDQEFAEA